jgi:predicted phosphoribosyltransferase
VAARVARVLRAPWDVLVVRKLGVPWSPEVAFGALGPGGIVVHNRSVEARLDPSDVATVVAAESAELIRREATYRGGAPPLTLTDRVAIVVDDGLATGATARVAVAVARQLSAAAVVVAVPVGAPDAVALLASEADQVVCPLCPDDFGSVSRYYHTFPQVTDDQVVALLGRRR